MKLSKHTKRLIRLMAKAGRVAARSKLKFALLLALLAAVLSSGCQSTLVVNRGSGSGVYSLGQTVQLARWKFLVKDYPVGSVQFIINGKVIP